MSIAGRIAGFLLPRPGRDRSGRTALDDALLFRAHEQASEAASSAMSATQTAGASAAQQRSTLDAAVDGVRLLLTRAREVRSGLAQAREALEQIRLVALNAGLEGARVGEPSGKPLVLVSDEIRREVARGLDALGEHSSGLDQMDREREKLRDQVETAQARAADLAKELLQAQAAQRDASANLADLGDRIKQATGTDPDTARAVTEVADHARALVTALSSLSARSPRASVLRALGPSLGPLLGVLRDLYRGGSDGEPP